MQQFVCIYTLQTFSAAVVGGCHRPVRAETSLTVVDVVLLHTRTSDHVASHGDIVQRLVARKWQRSPATVLESICQGAG